MKKSSYHHWKNSLNVQYPASILICICDERKFLGGVHLSLQTHIFSCQPDIQPQLIGCHLRSLRIRSGFFTWNLAGGKKISYNCCCLDEHLIQDCLLEEVRQSRMSSFFLAFVLFSVFALRIFLPYLPYYTISWPEMAFDH